MEMLAVARRVIIPIEARDVRLAASPAGLSLEAMSEGRYTHLARIGLLLVALILLGLFACPPRAYAQGAGGQTLLCSKLLDLAVAGDLVIVLELTERAALPVEEPQALLPQTGALAGDFPIRYSRLASHLAHTKG